MRAERLLSLVSVLQVRGRATAAELAGELGVSERTIYRDLDALGQAGFPIVTDRGPGGGCALLPGYRSRIAAVSSLKGDEARALMLAGLPGQAAELGFGALLAAGQRKLLAALPPRVRETATHAAERFHLDAGDWFRPSVEHPALPEVARLVWSDGCARIHYRRGDGEVVERVVAPLGLVLKSGLWYLVASVDATPRVYRVSRIQQIEALADNDDASPEQSGERDPDFDLGAYWRDWTESFEQSLPQYPVTLRLSPWATDHAEHLLGEPVRRAPPEPAPVVDDDGWQQRLVVFEKFEHAVRAVLGLGGHAEVVEPQALRDAVAEEARVVAALHHSA